MVNQLRINNFVDILHFYICQVRRPNITWSDSNQTEIIVSQFQSSQDLKSAAMLISQDSVS